MAWLSGAYGREANDSDAACGGTRMRASAPGGCGPSGSKSRKPNGREKDNSTSSSDRIVPEVLRPSLREGLGVGSDL